MPQHSEEPSVRRRPWLDRISPASLFVGLAGAVIATIVARATGAGWLPAVGLALLLGVGLYFWARDPEKGWGDLGQGIMVSVIVAIALMAVQRDADERTREADLRHERQIRESEIARANAADRENLQLALTMQSDLRGIALSGRDMHELLLARENLEGADLHGSDLTGADLRGIDFQQANLVGVRFDGARMAEADLRGAILAPERVRDHRDPQADLNDFLAATDPSGSERAPKSSTAPRTSFRGSFLENANLRRVALPDGVDFTGAQLLGAELDMIYVAEPAAGAVFRNADLRDADLRGSALGPTDLRGAKLSGARLCSAGWLSEAKLEGAQYDESTRWPRGFDPRNRGMERLSEASGETLELNLQREIDLRQPHPAC